MWENGTEKEATQLYPPKRRAVQEPQTNALLFVQCALCAAIVLFALLMRNVGGGAFQSLHRQYEQMLTQGVRIGEQNELVRFVSGGVQAVREQSQLWLRELEQTPGASGGYWPVLHKQLPAGVSIKKYTLAEQLQLPVEGSLSSDYGFRKNPVNGKDDFHAGIDIAAPTGTPVHASLNGQVVETGWNALRGNYMVLHHRGGLQTLYQHLSCVFTRTGETVAQGQVIGAVGETGLTTGPHLHFELVVQDVRVDPLLQFPQLAA